jgi:putative ABC transport system permease protein
MKHSLYIAWQYIRYHRVKTAILIACITVITTLPLALEILLSQSEQQLRQRAISSPLIIGAKGSQLDLVMSSLYFTDARPDLLRFEDSEAIWESELGTPVPIYVRFNARGYPVVGTTLDYFDLRSLQIAEGRPLATLGECVLGATVAEKLGLKPGDNLVTSPENLFDIAGIYPLKMKVAGVLAPAFSPDDEAVFVDIKTSWVVQGLGHGHQDLQTTEDSSVILKSGDDVVTANAKLRHYNEITDANRDSFHFHGNEGGFPVSALLVWPDDAKSETLLRGRHLNHETLQVLKPRQVVDELLKTIFRIKQILDAVILVVAIATLLAIALVFSLSWRLRENELRTMFLLGCSRSMAASLLITELLIVVAISAAASGILLAITRELAEQSVRLLLL